ncbi:MAG: YfcE family phosphodiesterase [Bacilli bacterium]|nr:YfcE family phosphodiesterase [Bacilli bacterium]
MTYLVVSDLHGSSRGLDLLKTAILMQKPDVLIVLGDILFGAFDGDEGACCRFFKGLTIPVMAVKGNCDYSSDGESLGFALPLSREFVFADRTFHLQHHPWYTRFQKGDVALWGHTHFKCLYEEAGVLYLNPGSIGKPRDDGPGYAIINETGIVLFDAAKLTPIKRLSFAR